MIETMISFKDAIAWAERQPDSSVKEYALNRMRYEAQKAEPIKPRFHKGKYGTKYDSYTCGKCGDVIGVTWKYCAACGKAIDR